jgi:hypothetical protein
MQVPLIRQGQISVKLQSSLSEAAKYARDLISRE